MKRDGYNTWWVGVAVAAWASAATTAQAYELYSKNPDGGCLNCHGTFDEPLTSLGGLSLHTLHRDPAYMGTACELCHFRSDYYRVRIDQSQGTRYNDGRGCRGCHQLDGQLVLHGGAASVCSRSDCHGWPGNPREDDVLSGGTYYGTPDTKVVDPCQAAPPAGEDFSGNGRGLDNDGDGRFDTDDDDCTAVCGNYVLEGFETCEPPLFPCRSLASCNDQNPDTLDELVGAPEHCNVRCRNTTPRCRDGDSYCPLGCSPVDDADCLALCGNFALDWGETCDPPSLCPTSCDDGDACTTGYLTGAAASCTAGCVYLPVTSCVDADGCCPVGCSTFSDSDCTPICGNGVLESGETCDPPASCPASCDDANACTADTRVGSPASCDVSCQRQVTLACIDGDGCCPAACDARLDDDCSPTCGNSRVEPGEVCDPPSDCPASCDDGDPCTRDVATGSAANCNLVCANDPVLCPRDPETTAPALRFESRGFVCGAAVSAPWLLVAVWGWGRRRRLTSASG